ncbi:MAG: RsmD family RNA methyltransferase [Sedimentisphaerales bacterium]|nr:RsmD family RNA methyltransferase [Sedimentisphaerales bacterium]
MRIIAGSRARRVLLAPRGRTTRPITDRVKESIFAILAPGFEGIRVADLFCGTGSLGLEALSRGARHALLVDSDADALQRLRQNIEALDWRDRTTVCKADLFGRGLAGNPHVPRPADENGDVPPWDLVFVDPPYRLSRQCGADSPLGRLLGFLQRHTADRAVVVLRQERRSLLEPSYGDLHLEDRREYGGMAVNFLRTIRQPR